MLRNGYFGGVKKPRLDDPILIAENNFAFFITHYFTDLVIKIKLSMGPHGCHRQMAKDIQACIERAIRSRSTEEDVWEFMTAPRDWKKSTMVRFLYLWLFAFPNKLDVPWIINLSCDQKKARVNLSYVKDIIQDHDEYREDFGFGGKKFNGEQDFENWNIDFIKSAPGVDKLGRARGRMLLDSQGYQGIRGLHSGIVVIDDPEEIEHVKNPDVLTQRKAIFARDIMPSIGTHRPLFVIGTMLSEDAIVTTVARGLNCRKGEPLEGWHGREYEATNADGTASYPEVFPLRRLDKIRSVMEAMSPGSYAFEFEGDVKAFKNTVWPFLDECAPPEETDNTGRVTFRLGTWDGMNWVPVPGAYHLTVFDPATKTKERNDFSAKLSAVVVKDRYSKWYGHAWVIDDWRAKVAPYDLMQKMHADADYFPGRLGVEASQGDVFAELLRHERGLKNVKTRVDSLPMWGQNLEVRARKGNLLVQLKRIHFAPWISMEARREILKFPFNRPDHDDYCSCLSLLQQMMSSELTLADPREHFIKKTRREEAEEGMSSRRLRDKFLPPVGRSNLPC